MTVSTDALLFYGIAFDEEDHQWPWNREGNDLLDEIEDEDDEDEDEDRDPEDEEGPENDGLDDEEREEKYGVTIGTHCMQSCPMGFVAIPSTFARAWRGYPVKISERSEGREHTPEDTGEGKEGAASLLKEWNKTLKAFCKAYDYDFDELMEDGKVGWFLCSDTDYNG